MFRDCNDSNWIAPVLSSFSSIHDPPWLVVGIPPDYDVLRPNQVAQNEMSVVVVGGVVVV